MKPLLIQKGGTAIVNGPARGEVLSGTVEAFGNPLTRGRKFVIRLGDSLPLVARTAAKLAVTADENRVSLFADSAIPGAWEELARDVMGLEKPSIVLFLGDVNTGKTGLITYVANTVFLQGCKLAVVDLDVGQHNIGPPTTLGVGFLQRSVTDMAEISPTCLWFVGSTSPYGHTLPIIVGAKRLVDRAKRMGAEVILMDTTGWVHGREARAFKIEKTLAIEPSMIVGLQRENELEPILRAFRHTITSVRRMKVPSYVDSRTPSVRKTRREGSFFRYFSAARPLDFPFRDIDFISSTLGNGHPISKEVVAAIEGMLNAKVVHCEVTGTECLITTSAAVSLTNDLMEAISDLIGVRDVVIISEGDEDGLITGLFDRRSETLGIGVVQRIDYRSERIRILTPADRTKVVGIRFGSMKISKEGMEIGRVAFKL
ncbi:MAG: Clp1/GlmU family protein [Candidatus Bathyarchaeia archaeon]